MKDDEKQAVEFAQCIAMMRQQMPANLEYIELDAKLIRTRYLFLIKEGFTENQALTLCKK